MQDISTNHRHRIMSGLTLVELIIAITVMGLLTAVILGTMGDFYESDVASLAQNIQDTDTRNVLRSIESELRNTAGWTSSLAVNVPLGPTNDKTNQETWSYCGTKGLSDCSQTANRVLIAYTNATDRDPHDQTRLPVFALTGGSCNTANAIDTVKVAQIYFVAPDWNNAAKNNLYRRTIVNPANAVPCGAIFQSSTCASSVSKEPGCLDTAGTSHTDAILIYDVNNFSVDYYNTASDPAPVGNEYTANPNIIANSQAVKLTVTTNRLIRGQSTTDKSDILISRPY